MARPMPSFRKSVLPFLSLLTSLVYVSSGHAGVGEVIDFRIHQQYVGTRPLGMGNAFIGLADDYNAIMYNPAGLARLEAGQINMGIGAMLDSKVAKLKSDIDQASKSGNVSDITTLLDANAGNYYAARATLGAAWARPKWGLAIFPLDLSLNMAIHKLGAASLDVVATQDTTIAYGRGWDVHWFQQDRMSLGVTAKFIYRGYFNRSFIAGDLAFDSNILRASDAQEGFTADADIGSLYTPKISSTSWMRFLRPTFGFVVRNVADYGFTTNGHFIDKNSGQAPKLGRRYDVGSVWELPDWWIFKTRALADVRDMGATNFTLQKGYHLGTEFLWKIRSWWQGGWRVGVSQGYFTAGFTGKFGIFNLDLVTFAEEMGPSDRSVASRQYALKASLDF